MNMDYFRSLVHRNDVEDAKDLIKDVKNINIGDKYLQQTILGLSQSIEMTKILIEAGANVNATDPNGRTDLFHARSGEMTKVLIEAGADVNVIDKHGYTPLVLSKNVKKTKALLEAGAITTDEAINHAPNKAIAKLLIKFSSK
jgi:ankyrin repeat protein